MDPNNQRPTSPQIPERHTTPAIPERSDRIQAQHQAATADIVRNQVDAAYQGHDPVGDQPDAHPAETAQQPNPYQRTHSTDEHATSAQWAHYHSAWQKYYQQYYERYYIGEIYKTQTELTAQQQDAKTTMADSATASDNMSRTEAIDDLRTRLKTSLNTRAKRFRASRHFVPIAAAMVVVLVFGFLQYNRNIFAAVNAYTSPGNVDPSNIIPPSADGTIKVSPEPLLIIPKLNINVPVDYSAKPDSQSQWNAMLNGTAYFGGFPGATAKPGQVGNFGIAGHSSNDVLDGGNYKFIFVNLPKMRENDIFYLNYQGTRYTYTVTKMREVQPTDVAAMTQPTDKPQVTLITCVPIGTADRRLLVTGTQVSPDPSEAAKAAPSSSGQPSGSTAMPGNSPTFIQRVFGGGN